MVTIADIRNAASVLDGKIIRTPVVYSPTFSEMTGARIYLKLENLQKAGSFKVRGATNKIARIGAEAREYGVIAASAGNHAQGVAVAAHEAGVSATIVMPESVSISKQEATEGYGAEVILKGQTLADSIRYAKERSKEGPIFIHPYDDPAIIAGQGTIALEIFDDLPDTDMILVPVGGGGLISGIATGAKAIRPDVRIIGVEPLACPSAYEARRMGHPVDVKPEYSIADGTLVTRVGDISYSIMADYVDSFVLVEEREIYQAILFLLARKKLLAEGAGSLGLAALLSGKISFTKDSTIVVVISGGNVDLPLLDRIIRQGLERSGRIMHCVVQIEDLPGSLARLLSLVADMRGNILRIVHIRSEPDLPINIIRVELEIETRNAGHGSEIQKTLERAGYVLEKEKDKS